MLQNDRQLANTRDKLRLLEESYEEVRQETGEDEELREAELESLKRFINQLKEEIARYEAHQPARR
jgi:flagellar biosynthesis chaperone FliJ